MKIVLLFFTLLPAHGGAVNYVGRERDKVLFGGAGTKKSKSVRSDSSSAQLQICSGLSNI